MLQRSQNRVGRIVVRGFTIVELMVTVAVLAILSAIAVPSFTNLIRGNRLTSAANEMVALLQTARAGAISNRASVTVCPSTDGSTCAAALGSRWIARMTKNGAATVLRDSTLHPDITPRASRNLANASNVFTFNPTGFSTVGAAPNGSLGLCHPAMSGNNGVDVSSNVGRVSSARRAATAACTAPGDN